MFKTFLQTAGIVCIVYGMMLCFQPPAQAANPFAEIKQIGLSIKSTLDEMSQKLSRIEAKLK